MLDRRDYIRPYHGYGQKGKETWVKRAFGCGRGDVGKRERKGEGGGFDRSRGLLAKR